jgi:integrase/recombinase XerD
MPTHNPENERIKHRYLHYLREAKRLSEHSADAAAAALSKFEAYTGSRAFKRFHIQQAIGFKRRLSEEVSDRTGEPLSGATILSILNALRAFFQWLSLQSGYKSRVSYADADYFTLPEREARSARVTLQRPVPSIDQILHVLRHMPSETEVQLRNRAVIAFTLLTGVRDGAAASLRLKHVDIIEGKLLQDAREVRTKFAKTFTTWFFPVGDDVREIAGDWVSYLATVKRWGPEDPLFPATRVVLGPDHQYAADGLSRAHWSNATPIRAIFQQAFTTAGLPYANPHSIRKTLAQLGERLCQTPEEFKAWSQNLGHEQVLTTFSSYGTVQAERQAELIRRLGEKREPHAFDQATIDRVMRALRDANVGNG